MLHNIPTELRVRKQWVCAFDDKVPRNPVDGKAASPTDPATWGTYEQAVQAGMKYIGYVLAADDPYSCIDLDNPRFLKKDVPDTDNDSVIRKIERHSHIVDAINSYSEISQSGEGVHIFLRGKVPNGVRRDCVEVYSSGRYIICTGNRLNPYPITDGQALLDVLYREMATTTVAGLEEREESISDEALWDMGSAAVNGDKFELLWAGDFRDYPSQSEADFALMAMLCYYSKANDQCRRLFRKSGLGQRDKAQRDKYLDYMISKCRAHEPPRVDLTQLNLNARKVTKTPPIPPSHDTRRINRPDQSEGPVNPDPVGQGIIQVPADHRGSSAISVTARPTDNGELQTDTNDNLYQEGSGVREELSEGIGRSVAPAIKYPPGLVGDLAEYFYSSALRPVAEVAFVSALAFVGGVAGRSYNISSTGLNQYIILLAKTGRGKEGIASGIDTLVAAIRSTLPMADRFVGPAAFASGQALVRVLDERPCFFSILGEFGTTMQMLCDPRAPSSTVMLKRALLDLYNKSGFSKVLRGSVYSDTEKNTKSIRAPAVTILGESTPEKFYDALDTTFITDGFLPRFSIVEYVGRRPGRNRKAFHAPADELTARATELVRIALTTEQNNTCQPVGMDSYAEVILDELDSHADKEINEGGGIAAELWNRSHLKALKLAALLAVGINPHDPVITKDLALYAREFVVRDVELISTKFATGDVGTGQSKQEQDIRRVVAGYLTLPRRTRESYKVPEKMLDQQIIPYHYMRRRLKLIASFKDDRRGFVVALDAMLAVMVKEGTLVEIDRRTLRESFEVNSPAYAVGPAF